MADTTVKIETKLKELTAWFKKHLKVDADHWVEPLAWLIGAIAAITALVSPGLAKVWLTAFVRKVAQAGQLTVDFAGKAAETTGDTLEETVKFVRNWVDNLTESKAFLFLRRLIRWLSWGMLGLVLFSGLYLKFHGENQLLGIRLLLVAILWFLLPVLFVGIIINAVPVKKSGTNKPRVGKTLMSLYAIIAFTGVVAVLSPDGFVFLTWLSLVIGIALIFNVMSRRTNPFKHAIGLMTVLTGLMVIFFWAGPNVRDLIHKNALKYPVAGYLAAMDNKLSDHAEEIHTNALNDRQIHHQQYEEWRKRPRLVTTQSTVLWKKFYLNPLQEITKLATGTVVITDTSRTLEDRVGLKYCYAVVAADWEVGKLKEGYIRLSSLASLPVEQLEVILRKQAEEIQFVTDIPASMTLDPSDPSGFVAGWVAEGDVIQVTARQLEPFWILSSGLDERYRPLPLKGAWRGDMPLIPSALHINEFNAGYPYVAPNEAVGCLLYRVSGKDGWKAATNGFTIWNQQTGELRFEFNIPRTQHYNCRGGRILLTFTVEKATNEISFMPPPKFVRVSAGGIFFEKI